MAAEFVEVASPFQKKPAYRYLRKTDKLPTSPPRGATDGVVLKVRLFNPTGIGTWWVASYDPATGVAFGVVSLHETEVGDFYMPELVEYRGRFGLPVERDLYYTPVTVGEVIRGEAR